MNAVKLLRHYWKFILGYRLKAGYVYWINKDLGVIYSKEEAKYAPCYEVGEKTRLGLGSPIGIAISYISKDHGEWLAIELEKEIKEECINP